MKNQTLPEEFLRMQKIAGIITETEYRLKLTEADINLDDTEQKVVDSLKDEMSTILKSLDSELTKASETEEKPTNEALLTVASIAIALPAILGIISNLGKAVGATISQLLGKKPSEEDAYQQWMSKLGHIADELHHLYLTPIKAIVSKFIKDSAKADKVSDAIFHVIVAVFMVASGVTAVKALQAKNISLSGLELALVAVKKGEINSYISNLLK
jgi:hypothetical protein